MMLLHCLLVLIVLKKICCNHYMYPFPQTVLKIFCVTNFVQFDHFISLFRLCFGDSCTGVHWAVQLCKFIVHQIWKNFCNNLFFKIFFVVSPLYHLLQVLQLYVNRSLELSFPSPCVLYSFCCCNFRSIILLQCLICHQHITVFFF